MLALEEAGVVDRHRGAVGRELEQARLVRHEPAVAEAAHAEDPDDSPLGDQGHAHQRVQTGLAHLRRDLVGVVDVVDHDRARVGRDPSGKPLPDRDAYRAPALLWEPARGVHAERLVRPVAEHRHRHVHREHLAHARHELVEEVVQLQVAERDVRHLLELAEGLGRAVGLQPRVALRRV